MNVDELLARAQVTLNSAKLLFDSKDVNGACNRAYYAMFDAARAALFATQAPVKSESIKTHSGLISAFSQHLIKTALLPVDLGKALSKVSEIRLAADYSDEEVSSEDAAWVLEQSNLFVAGVTQAFAS